MKWFILSLIISVISGKGSLAQDNIKYIFYKANTLYEQARYEEAIAEYNKILNKGFESGNLYYNLGNCYFKKGELGRAILNYEKAKRLIPRDRDLESNYEYAKSQIKGEVPEVKKIWPLRVLNRFLGHFTIDGIVILLSIVYILTILVIFIGLYHKIPKRYSVVIICSLIIIFISGVVLLNNKISLFNKEAVVIEKTDARFEPFDRATVHFTLYEGMKVHIISSKPKWYKVRRSDGKSGWIKNTSIELKNRIDFFPPPITPPQ